MHQNGYIGRKMRSSKLKEQSAIVMVAFGSSKRGKAALDLVEGTLQQEFPNHEIFWAYSSAIIRKRTGHDSPHQALARAEAAGYRRVVVQPLHVFSGTEYQQLAETCAFFPGLRVFLGETLLHRWAFIREILNVVGNEFLAPDEGLNLLALHGTPLAADPVNVVYLGLERMVSGLYQNVLAASVEGVPDFSEVLQRIAVKKINETYNKVKIIPMMFISGMHVEDDLMGERDSWRQGLEALGFQVECPMVVYEGERFFKGLAFYPEVVDAYMERLRRSLELARYY